MDIEDKNSSRGTGQAEVVIEKLGNLPVPIKLKITFADSSEQIIEKQADVWKDGKQSYLLNFDHETQIDKIELGDKYNPNINLDDNKYVIK